MLKILQARLQQYVDHKLPDVQNGFRKGSAKEHSNYSTIALISHATKVMLKILQARLQQYVNCELSDVQAGFKRQRNQRPNCQHLLDH